MARHRNVRGMQYEEDDFYDPVGSFSDEPECISPTDARQWIFDRARGQASLDTFLAENEDIQEENDDEMTALDNKKDRRDSESFQIPELSDVDKAKLMSCMEEIRNITGDTYSDKKLYDTIIANDFDIHKALDQILNDTNPTTQPTSKKPKVNEVQKGISDILLERAEKTKILIPTVTVITPMSSRTTKGFEVSSPKDLTPIGSGRNSPEEENNKQPNKMTKEALRNAHELFVKERGKEKEQIHLVVIGHVDAGKSTMMGHLLVDLGNVSQKTMHKYEQESRKLGKQSFMYAWVLDETGEERTRGITMDCGYQRFETETKQVTLLDAPGHRDFIPNMICGANQADCAILVVDATRGEFEAGFEQGGQTREHALLVRSLGVNQMCVAVNKLDNENWSKDRFDEIVGKLKIFLKQAGFKESDINYIPCSGLTGENLVKAASDPQLTSWYNGPTVLNIVDNFKTPERAIDKPFRMSISDVYKGTGSNFCLSGRIASGHVCPNDKILICPSKEQGQVKSITIDDVPVNTAFAGDQVSITLSGIDTSNVSIGSVLSESFNVVPIANKVRVRILVFNLKTPITIGYPVLMHHQSLVEPATITKLKAQLHKSTAEVVKKNPRVLANNSCGLVELTFQRPIAIEKYASSKEMGRVMLRVGGVTIATGHVTEIVN